MFDFLRNLTKSAGEKRQEAISAYLDGVLTPVERRHFEQQLARNQDLQMELEQQRLLQQTLRQLPRRPVPRNFTLDPALYGRPEPQPLLRLYPGLRLATALTAIFFIVAVVLDLVAPAGAPAFSPAGDSVSMAVEVTTVVSEEIIVEGEAVEVTRIVTEVVVEEEAAAEPAAEVAMEEAAEEPAEEEPAAADELLTLEAAEDEATQDSAGAILERTVEAEAPALAATAAETLAASPLSTATADPAGEEPPVTADIAPAEAARDNDIQVTRTEPLSSLRRLQIGLGAAFVLLALITYLARRQL